jgi:hypothetical protein
MRQKATVTVGSIAGIGGLAALQGMSFEEFIAWALTAGGAAAIVWGIIALLEKFWRAPLSSNFKFYFAQVLGFLVPFVAYGVSVWAGWNLLSTETLFATALVAYQVSQTIHWEGDQAKKQDLQEVERTDEVLDRYAEEGDPLDE